MPEKNNGKSWTAEARREGILGVWALFKCMGSRTHLGFGFLLAKETSFDVIDTMALEGYQG